MPSYIPKDLYPKKPMMDQKIIYNPSQFAANSNSSALTTILSWPEENQSKLLAYIKENPDLNLKDPTVRQEVINMFAPETIELANVPGVEIPYEVPKLETPEALRVAEEQKEGKTRPENGV